MRAIAGGLSAGGSLAPAHHFLNLVEPRDFDPLTVYSHLGHNHWVLSSFAAGLASGMFLVLFIRAFVTLRSAFAELVTVHLEARGAARSSTGGSRKAPYKLL